MSEAEDWWMRGFWHIDEFRRMRIRGTLGGFDIVRKRIELL
jgi:hypothetical protein